MSTAAPVEAMPRDYLLSPTDLVGLFRVDKQTIHEWATTGQLPPPVRIGRTLRWKRETIEALLSGGPSTAA